VYELDHFSLGVRNLYEGCHRLREETGLDNYDGGWFRGVGIANRIVPLPGDAYIEVEAVIDHYQPVADGEPARFKRWFEDTLKGGDDHWMFWCLRTKTLEDLDDVARRFGTTVTTVEGRIRPNGFVGSMTLAPDVDSAFARGLPNWYFTPDPSVYPSRERTVEHRRPLREIAWLEVGGDARELEEHVGTATFDSLPLRFVDRPAGLYGVGLKTVDGDEIAIRKESAVPYLPARTPT
jgi:Glyoxalase-like domain